MAPHTAWFYFSYPYNEKDTEMEKLLVRAKIWGRNEYVCEK